MYVALETSRRALSVDEEKFRLGCRILDIMNDESQEPKLEERTDREGPLSGIGSYILNEPHHIDTVQ